MREIIDNRPFKERIKIKFQKKLEEIEANKEIKQNIKKLKKEKRYDDIYTLYGQDVYLYYAPEKYIKKDIKNLLKKGLFEDIYTKYGSPYYNSYIPKMEAIDIYMETEKKFKGLFNKARRNLYKKYLAYFTSGALLLNAAPPLLISMRADQTISENARKYVEDIIGYDLWIKDYSEQIKKLNLNDLQTIMKVIDDMWQDIDGYGTPKKDVEGFERLDFAKAGGVGVCRNMADDVTAKLNMINPEYNARNMNVYASDGKYRLNDIKTKDAPTYVPSETNSEPEENSNNMTRYTGNHRVTLVDIKEDNVTLVVDPTNPSLGVFDKGAIYMFSSADGKGYESPYYRQALNGSKSQYDNGVTLIKSYFNNHDLEYLKNKYGIDAENKALEEAREIADTFVNGNIKLTSNYEYTYDFEKSMRIEDEEVINKVR